MSAVSDFVRNQLSFGSETNLEVAPAFATPSGHVSLDLVPAAKPIGKTSTLPIFQPTEELALPTQQDGQEQNLSRVKKSSGYMFN